MARMPGHVHKFKRYVYKNGTKVFFCALPDCLFKIGIEFALGKRCICWRCGNEFILTNYALRLAHPHCPDCHGLKDGPKKQVTEIEKINVVDDLKTRMDSLINDGLAVKDEEL